MDLDGPRSDRRHGFRSIRWQAAPRRRRRASREQEGRDRRFQAKIDRGFSKAFELRDEAAELRRKAEAAESNRAISSDEPEPGLDDDPYVADPKATGNTDDVVPF